MPIGFCGSGLSILPAIPHQYMTLSFSMFNAWKIEKVTLEEKIKIQKVI
jgi:hypothetical protein